MTQEQDIVERLTATASNLRKNLDNASFGGDDTFVRVKAPNLLMADLNEAAQTIAALRAERDIAARNRDAARDNFLTMQQSAAILLNRAEAAEAEVKELEAEISNLDAELDHWSQLAVDDLGKNPPILWKEIAATAIRERDELRKALEQIREEDWSEYQTKSGPFKVPGKGATIAITALDDLRRSRIASSNREGGEE